MNYSLVLPPIANIGLEAAVVGVVCIIFLVLMVVAGIRQAKKLND